MDLFSADCSAGDSQCDSDIEQQTEKQRLPDQPAESLLQTATSWEEEGAAKLNSQLREVQARHRAASEQVLKLQLFREHAEQHEQEGLRKQIDLPVALSELRQQAAREKALLVEAHRQTELQHAAQLERRDQECSTQLQEMRAQMHELRARLDDAAATAPESKDRSAAVSVPKTVGSADLVLGIDEQEGTSSGADMYKQYAREAEAAGRAPLPIHNGEDSDDGGSSSEASGTTRRVTEQPPRGTGPSPARERAEAVWFRGQPPASASDMQIAKWFRGQPSRPAQQVERLLGAAQQGALNPKRDFVEAREAALKDREAAEQRAEPAAAAEEANGEESALPVGAEEGTSSGADMYKQYAREAEAAGRAALPAAAEEGTSSGADMYKQYAREAAAGRAPLPIHNDVAAATDGKAAAAEEDSALLCVLAAAPDGKAAEHHMQQLRDTISSLEQHLLTVQQSAAADVARMQAAMATNDKEHATELDRVQSRLAALRQGRNEQVQFSAGVIESISHEKSQIEAELVSKGRQLELRLQMERTTVTQLQQQLTQAREYLHREQQSSAAVQMELDQMKVRCDKSDKHVQQLQRSVTNYKEQNTPVVSLVMVESAAKARRLSIAARDAEHEGQLLQEQARVCVLEDQVSKLKAERYAMSAGMLGKATREKGELQAAMVSQAEALQQQLKREQQSSLGKEQEVQRLQQEVQRLRKEQYKTVSAEISHSRNKNGLEPVMEQQLEKPQLEQQLAHEQSRVAALQLLITNMSQKLDMSDTSGFEQPLARGRSMTMGNGARSAASATAK